MTSEREPHKTWRGRQGGSRRAGAARQSGGPGARPSEPKRLVDSLDAVTRTLGGPSATALAALFGNWADVVGDEVAAHSRPLSLTKGVLAIAVDDPGWATQLTYLQAHLVARVEAALGPGHVTSVAIRVRPR